MRLKLEFEYHQNYKDREDEINLRIKFESKLRELNGKLDYVNNKLRVVERDFFEAEKAIGSKNIKLSNQDDKIIELEELNLNWQHKYQNEKTNKESVQAELAVKNDSIIDYDLKYNVLRDKHDINLYDVEDMTK
jgi:hypothetical protein